MGCMGDNMHASDYRWVCLIDWYVYSLLPQDSGGFQQVLWHVPDTVWNIFMIARIYVASL